MTFTSFLPSVQRIWSKSFSFSQGSLTRADFIGIQKAESALSVLDLQRMSANLFS